MGAYIEAQTGCYISALSQIKNLQSWDKPIRRPLVDATRLQNAFLHPGGWMEALYRARRRGYGGNSSSTAQILTRSKYWRLKIALWYEKIPLKTKFTYPRFVKQISKSLLKGHLYRVTFHSIDHSHHMHYLQPKCRAIHNKYKMKNFKILYWC